MTGEGGGEEEEHVGEEEEKERVKVRGWEGISKFKRAACTDIENQREV